MAQKRKRGVGVVVHIGCGLLALAAIGCVGGGRKHTAGLPKTFVAEFNAPGCAVYTQAGLPATEVRFFMIDGRKAFSLLVLDKLGQGVELENYWKDDQGHHWVGNTQNGPGWHYAIPDKRGVSGKLSSYSTYIVKAEGDHLVLEGDAKESCELAFVAAGTRKNPEGPVAVAPPSTPEPACTPGETRECVGAAACRGGQACLPDRTGFGACDCGSTTPPPPPPSVETPPPAAIEGGTTP